MSPPRNSNNNRKRILFCTVWCVLSIAGCGELPNFPDIPQYSAGSTCPHGFWVECEQMDADQAQLLIDALDAHFALSSSHQCDQARAEITQWLTHMPNSWVYMAAIGGEPGGVYFSGGQPQHVGFVSWLWGEASHNIARIVIHEGYHLAFGQTEPPLGWEDACLDLN